MRAQLSRRKRGVDAALQSALAQSFNTAAIRLSVKIGEAYWPPKQSYHLGKIAALGRVKIVETARAMGVTTPLVDTVSLPIGADEVKMIDMVGANATLANGGMRVDALCGGRNPQFQRQADLYPRRTTARRRFRCFRPTRSPR